MVIDEENMAERGMIKLDVKDRKILYYLSLNARQGYTQLAKKVALSKNAVKYRVERLVREKIITNFTSSINLDAMGLNTFTMLLKFNEDIYKNKRIFNYFKEHQFADTIEVLSGDWDIFVEFVIKDLDNLYDIVNGIVSEFGDTLNDYNILFSNDLIKVENLIPDLYAGLNLQEPARKTRHTQKLKLDLIDKKILSLVSIESNLTFLEIAEKLGLTLDVVRYRMKNLVKNNIILKFFPKISLIKLGYSQYLFTLKLKNISNEKLKRLKSEISENGSINYAFFDAVSSNLVFICAFSSNDEVDALSRALRGEFRDIIERQNYLIIREHVLMNLFPKGLVK